MHKPVSPDDDNHIPAQLRAETMAYALQSGVYNLAANFFEPYISYRVQRHFAGSTKNNNQANYGNYTQNLAGEFAGDIFGASSLMMAEAFVPEQFHAASRQIRKWVDPVYEQLAQRVLSDHKAEPDYRLQVEEWKTFQERNLVRSGFVAATGMAGNIIAQKTLIGNPSPTSLIFKGKLASTALTTVLGLASRLAFPSQISKMDSWIGKKMFTAILDDKRIDASGEYSL